MDSRKTVKELGSAGRQVAHEALLQIAEVAARSIVGFCEWLTLGLAGVFSLLVANFAVIAGQVGTRSLRFGLLWLGCSLAAGLYARWLSSGVFGGIEVARSAKKYAEVTAGSFSYRAYAVEIMRATKFPYRRRMWRSLMKPRSQLPVPIGVNHKLQLLNHVVFGQIFFCVVAAFVLIAGSFGGPYVVG